MGCFIQFNRELNMCTYGDFTIIIPVIQVTFTVISFW